LGRPSTFYAGEHARWTETADTITVTPGSTLHFRLINANGKEDFDGTLNGSDWDFDVVPTLTSYGNYSAVLYEKNSSGEKTTLERWSVILYPNLSTATTGVDGRSPARIMLDNIEAALQKNAAMPEATRQAHARSWGYKSLREMMDVRDRLRREVEAEENALNGTDTTTARVTFVAP
jgi:hypothetical protein